MKSNARLVMSSLMILTFLTAIEGTVVSTAMPKIVSELQGLQLMNWVFSIYLLLSAITVPIFGKLSDLFGRKRIFFVGTIIFLVGSALCGVSQTMEQLIVFRALQGIGAGAIIPIASIIIGDIFPVEKRAKMIGMLGMVWGISGVLGPLVGGFFVDQISWHWIFFFNLPFGIAAMLMLGISFKETVEKTKKNIDYWGAAVFAAAMFSLLYALQKGGESDQWTSPAVVGLLVAFAVLMVLFLFIESRVKDPLIPLQLFRIRAISVTNIVSLLVSAILIGLTVYIPIWVQGVLGFSATRSGFVLTPMSLTWMFGSFLCGKLLMKRGVRFTSVIGYSLIIVITLWLSLLSSESPQFQLYLITAIQGIGFGLIVTLGTVSVQSAVDWSMRGVATSSNVFFRNLGQTVGAALLGTYFNSRLLTGIQEKQAAGESVDMDAMNRLINPQLAGQLDPAVQDSLRKVLIVGVNHVFLALLVIAAAGFLISLLLPRNAGEQKSAQQG
ncbi:MDR family MFS transporter [Paenibacillus sp. J2TS4]|uniref:MDR family MFS transporter n=1 Tax=Paenibacillus sp. J2TS4 TaxID=2807194 RepID=UPI001B10D13B|nr:MDR family MFS transporter [Paenibacillus sp. J2TS4]GIP35774.1 MFS transporter [Paenibacillus sp. J2TS4]